MVHFHIYLIVSEGIGIVQILHIILDILWKTTLDITEHVQYILYPLHIKGLKEMNFNPELEQEMIY